MYSRRHKKQVTVLSCPILFNKKTGIEQEAEQVTNGATYYTQTVASLNYMYTLAESNEAERSTISVDQLVLEVIEIN